jgi:RNA polymerase sigma-70 factor (sigma-E family)
VGKDDESRHGDIDRVFELFVLRHGKELSRLAYLLIGDPDGADDLTSEVFLIAWRQWDRVQAADSPIQYLRRVMANTAASRIRRLRLERRKLLLFRQEAAQDVQPPDGAVVDVRRALRLLPARRRSCVVLRLAFDLSEREVAQTLGITVGTVKSQTSKGVRQFRQLLADDVGEPPAGRADADGPEAGPGGAGRADAGCADAGCADSGCADEGCADAGRADEGCPDAGPPGADPAAGKRPLDRRTARGAVPGLVVGDRGARR